MRRTMSYVLALTYIQATTSRPSQRSYFDVLLPPGRWRADDGVVFDGPCRIEVKTPLSRLPYFLSAAK